MYCDAKIFLCDIVSSNGSHRLSIMVLILLFMSKLLADNNAFLSDQIFQTITLFGNSSCDGPSLVLVLARGVHMIRFAVLVIASPLSRA